VNKFILVFFLLGLTSTIIKAKTFKEDDAFAQLKQEVSLNKNENAWALAQTHIDEYLGDADFDFLYGLIALRVNQEEHAVYAFERVVANKPNWLDAQYFLANAYFKVKNYHAVIDILNGLEEVDSISSKLKSSVTQLKLHTLTLLDKQSLYINHSAGVYMGYDSNINAGTSEDNIFLPFLGEEILLSDSSREISDNYVALNYQLRGNKALTQSSKLVFSGVGQLHYFAHESDYSRSLINLSMAYQKDFEYFSTSIGARVTPLWLDNSFYRTQFGTTLGLSKSFYNNWFIATEAYIGKTKNDVNQLLNTDDKSIQVTIQYLQDTWQHELSAVYTEEISEFTESQHNDRKTNMLNYSSYWAIAPKWLVSATVSYQHQAYQHEHPFFFEKRTDDMWLFGASIQYQESDTWSYRLSANKQDKDSNLSLFSYQRSDISLSAHMSF
jgi:hypothetical protein